MPKIIHLNIIYGLLVCLLCVGCDLFPSKSSNFKSFEPFEIIIEKTHGSLQGQQEEISIYLDSINNPTLDIGGFEFLVEYDPTVLTLQSAEPGQLLNDCEWEYFTYKQGPQSNCGPNPCPSGMLRIVAIAETSNGNHSPSCYSGEAGQLVAINFLVTNDYTYNCTFSPIRWKWYDCGDNSIASQNGDTLYLNKHVYGFDNEDITNYNSEFPTYEGISNICVFNYNVNRKRYIDFYNGGIDIICVDSIDGSDCWGPSGLEIADAVFYSNYFIYGMGIFSNPELQIQCSDVNADGIVLDLSDFVYLIRIIIGNASPYPQDIEPFPAYVNRRNGIVSVDGIDVGAVHIVLEGEVVPELLLENMELNYNFDGNNTNLLVYSFQGNYFTDEDFIDIGNNLIIDISFATKEGYRVYVANISGRIISDADINSNSFNED